MKSHKRASKASGSTVQKIREIVTGSGRYSNKSLTRKWEQSQRRLNVQPT